MVFCTFLNSPIAFRSKRLPLTPPTQSTLDARHMSCDVPTPPDFPHATSPPHEIPVGNSLSCAYFVLSHAYALTTWCPLSPRAEKRLDAHARPPRHNANACMHSHATYLRTHATHT